jgi:glutamyl-tRNA reductase
MTFFVCGVNYKTAPLFIREKVAQHLGSTPFALTHLKKLQEHLILSTCNRTEIYAETNDKKTLLSVFTDFFEIPLLEEHLYCYEGYDAIHHTLRVACGIDSMMLGEPQILGQMKRAYTLAEELGSARKQLRSIFPFIFSASKRIRHQSGIGHNPISIASAATHLIAHLFSDFTKLNTLIIGTGEMATLVTKYLAKQGVHHFFVASRTLENATILAESLQAPSLTISEIPSYLKKVDLVITATSCPMPFIDKKMVEQALTSRPDQPLVILDLAVPRDVEEEVGQIKQVSLFNVDDLHATIKCNMIKKQKAAAFAEELIQEQLQEYTHWRRSLKAKHVIRDFRTQMQGFANSELQRAKQQLNNGQCQYSVLNEFSERLLNKLMHLPTLGLKQAASDNRQELLELAEYLFTSSLSTISHEKIS